MIHPPRLTARRAAAAAALLAAALLAVACGRGSGSPASATLPPGAAASSAAAAGRAYASSSAGATARTEAQQIANACAHVLGPQGFNAMAPGVPGAPAARKAFWGCEKIPAAALFSTGVCLTRAYTSAPPKGPAGSQAEQARQAYLTDRAGHCIATAKHITLQTGPPAAPHPTGSPS